MKNNYKIIAKFKYHNNKYFIANLNDSKNVLVKYNEEKKIETEFTDEEYSLLNLICNSLCIDTSNSVYIKDEIINNNLYKIYYDTNSKNYFWNSDNEEANKILNFKYNNMIDTFYIREMDEEQQIAEIEKIIKPLLEILDKDNENIENQELTESEIVRTRKIVEHIKKQREAIEAQKQYNIMQPKEDDDVRKNINKDSKEKLETNNEKQEKFSYYTKMIRFKKKTIPILVSAIMAFGAFSPVFGANGRRIEKIEQQPIETIEETVKSEYKYSELAQSLAENPYLTQEEKDFISKFQLGINEDNEYINLDMIYDRFRTLKISYEKDAETEKKDNYMILAGTYNEIENQITMNGAYDFQEADKKDLAHELGHVMQESSQRYIMELINEMYTREKLRKLKENGTLEPELFEDSTNSNSNFGNGYSNHIYIGYIFASLMDEETLKKYQYSCNDKLLADKLVQIDKSVPQDVALSNAYQLLESIDRLRVWNSEKNIFEINPEAEEECREKLNYYYLQKTGKNIEEDLNCVIYKPYYDKNVYSTIEVTLQNEDNSIDLLHRSVLPKSYFSGEHKNAIIAFNESTQIEITDELCEKYRQNYIQIERGTDYER